mgnify:CR=1 FL=1
MIKFFDYSKVLKPHKKKIYKNFDKTFESGVFILGEEVKEFEKKFVLYTGAKHAIGVSSGTDALLSIFMSLGLQQGDEVIVTPYTFIASITSIVRAGLKPVFVDLEKDSFHPSTEKILNAWTEKTKAVLFVHLFGECKETSQLKEICDARGAFLIEDCAQSFGSRYLDGSHVGTIGHAAAFSFFPAKNLGCLGDGGMVITNDDSLEKKIRMIRAHGSKKRYYHELLGGNFRLDSIQAAALNVLIDEVDKWIERRKRNAEYYLKNIKNSNIISLPPKYDGNSWNQFVIRTKFRDELKNYLMENGVEVFIYWNLASHKQEVFRDLDFSDVSLPETNKRCEEVLAIPVYPGLTNKERKTIVKLINDFKV